MLKTVKVKKRMSFSEMIEYVLTNKIYPINASSSQGRFKVRFSNNGTLSVTSHSQDSFRNPIISAPDTIWEIEVHEQIGMDDELKSVVALSSEGEIDIDYNISINSILLNDDPYVYVTKIYMVIDGELEIIWEKGDEDE